MNLTKLVQELTEDEKKELFELLRPVPPGTDTRTVNDLLSNGNMSARLRTALRDFWGEEFIAKISDNELLIRRNIGKISLHEFKGLRGY